MNTYNYIEHDGHFIVQGDAGLWLLDTGAPMSVANGAFKIGNDSIDAADNYMGIGVAELNEMVGTYFDVLLGMDVIGKLGFLINRDEKTVSFGSDMQIDTANDNATLRTQAIVSVPSVELNIGGTNHRVFFDTGAKITYLGIDTVHGYRPKRQIDDFYPGFGQFQADVYEVPADIGGRQTVIEVGVLPDSLHAALMMAGVTGILGNSAWKGRSLAINPYNKTLSFDAALVEQQQALLSGAQ